MGNSASSGVESDGFNPGTYQQSNEINNRASSNSGVHGDSGPESPVIPNSRLANTRSPRRGSVTSVNATTAPPNVSSVVAMRARRDSSNTPSDVPPPSSFVMEEAPKGIMAQAHDGYQRIVNAIIRPPRADDYSARDLGPSYFQRGGRIIWRFDGELKNSVGQRLQYSFWVLVKKDPSGERSSLASSESNAMRSSPKSKGIALGSSMSNENVVVSPPPIPLLPLPRGLSVIPSPCVIYMHGNSSCRVAAIADCLLPCIDAGACVFAFDFSGSGHSDGDYVTLGFNEQQDLASVVAHVRNHAHVQSIALWGRSMGAATAILYSSRDDLLAGIICDSAFADLRRLCSELVSFGSASLGVDQRVMGFLFPMALRVVRNSVKKKTNMDINTLKPISVAADSSTPALFCAGAEDDFVSPAHSKDLYDIYGTNVGGEVYKELRIVRGDHNSSRPEEFYDFVEVFLARIFAMDHLLGRSPSTGPSNPTSTHSSFRSIGSAPPQSPVLQPSDVVVRLPGDSGSRRNTDSFQEARDSDDDVISSNNRNQGTSSTGRSVSNDDRSGLKKPSAVKSILSAMNEIISVPPPSAPSVGSGVQDSDASNASQKGGIFGFLVRSFATDGGSVGHAVGSAGTNTSNTANIGPSSSGKFGFRRQKRQKNSFAAGNRSPLVSLVTQGGGAGDDADMDLVCSSRSSPDSHSSAISTHHAAEAAETSQNAEDWTKKASRFLPVNGPDAQYAQEHAGTAKSKSVGAATPSATTAIHSSIISTSSASPSVHSTGSTSNSSVVTSVAVVPSLSPRRRRTSQGPAADLTASSESGDIAASPQEDHDNSIPIGSLSHMLEQKATVSRATPQVLAAHVDVEIVANSSSDTHAEQDAGELKEASSLNVSYSLSGDSALRSPARSLDGAMSVFTEATDREPEPHAYLSEIVGVDRDFDWRVVGSNSGFSNELGGDGLSRMSEYPLESGSSEVSVEIDAALVQKHQ